MKYLKAAIVITILVFAGLFLRSTDFEKVAACLHRIGYNFILLIFISFISYFLGTIAWRYCMGAEGKKVSISELFIVRHIGETVGIVSPASIVAGEATKVYLLRNHPVRKTTVVTSVLLSRVIMMLTQVVIFLIASLYMVLGTSGIKVSFGPVGKSHYAVIIVCLGLVAALTLRRQIKHLLLKTKAGIYLRNRTVKLRSKVSAALLELSLFFKSNKRSLVMSVVFFMMHWIAGSLEFLVILHLLGVTVSFIPVIFVDMSVILFKSAGAFVPAQIGIEEYGNKVMLANIGITALEVWVTASVLRRARQLFWIVFGLGTYFFIDRKKSSLLHPDNGSTVYEP